MCETRCATSEVVVPRTRLYSNSSSGDYSFDFTRAVATAVDFADFLPASAELSGVEDSECYDFAGAFDDLQADSLLAEAIEAAEQNESVRPQRSINRLPEYTG